LRWGQLIVKRVMHALGIVPDEPIHEFPIKRIAIRREQLIVEVHKLFLNRAIEAFGVRIHFRCFWIGMYSA